ncbi:amino acid/amide ABC transporter membrane protein 2, HAAT family [Tistlia consotensis]|uniref:Amino acid/amide ABC transporter membrane protein 2, HAAT family n=1 Tax=Tistlia consotensis USBA 355 TaxID=560819 RepID=A0A1Y6C776_9PROT|nr:branched-chain amino acid ABC transporter permease [Tistlia consotensis]SMF45666.1 amino acid/amide ABC transporter membrane protein 2, HAAT family [Tistlia consotensis USBA 355]SNR79523.1 amino acid/amide ABC transporter membrane protein 2, HAAT family [Tistlia consotensis]
MSAPRGLPRGLLAGLAGIALLALVTWLLPQLVSNYLVRVVIVMCINAVLVASMGLANGFTGVFSLGHVGFVAVGAYVSGILSLSAHAKGAYLPDLPHWLAGITLGFLPSTLVAGLVCVALAFLVGAPLMRLSGYFVAVATLGFLIIVNVVLINAVDFTRGARTFTGVPLETSLPWAVGWLAVAVAVIARVVYSPVGRRYRAVREDTIAAQAIGLEVLPVRLSAFMLGAFFAGVGGSLYGHYLGSFSPAAFYLAYTFTLISMLVIGGMQSLTGALVGVVAVSVASEVLRNLERGLDLGIFTVPPLYGASQVVLGFILILVMIFRPSGIMGDRELTLGPLVKPRQEGPGREIKR